MPVSRMRMRPWLESRIESNAIDGLHWVNKEERMFSIPWKHAARHGWEVDKDACLFKQWAIHTGKYKEGVTTADPKTWKANFRCAMNSLPDIEEVKDKSINKGCGAVRVYRMLPAVSKKGKRPKNRDARRRSKTAVKVKAEEMSSEEMQTQVSTVTSTDEQSAPSPSVEYEVEMAGYGDIYPAKFQVSPMHSDEFEESEAILELTRQLERESNLFGKGFLGNEVTATESLCPESQWSVSSGEELELRLYTELTPDLRNDFCTYTEMWSAAPQTMCPL